MKFGVIGTNFISDRFAEAASVVEGAEITAVYSRAEETGEAFAKRHGIEKVYTSLEQMLEEGGIDAVYVASPTLLHKEHSILAMKAGCDVLCEKMIATDYESFLEMKAVAEKCGAVLIEAMRPDFDPAIKTFAEALPLIGRVRRASFEYCQYSSRYDRFLSGIMTNAFDPTLKNSALSDIGIYPLHLCVSLFGEPKELVSKSVYLDGGFEGLGSVILNYGDMLATVTYSKITESIAPTVIDGELGSITLDKINAPKEITLRLRGQEPRAIPISTCENNMTYEIEEFMRLKEIRDSSHYLSVTEKTMRLVDKIYSSSGIVFPEI